jgi:glyoxylase-like metal-dependent hydrolase (beta-lactamase superfamily II)
LFVHSPTRLDAALQNALAALGNVASIVAPSWWHDLYLREYAAAYPSAGLYGPPALARSMRTVRFAGVLGVDPVPWADEIEQLSVDGMRLFLDEYVFFHRASRSCIVADLAFYLPADAPWFYRWPFMFVGAYPKCGVPWFFRLAPKSRAHLRAKLRSILAWEFDRLIVGHGGVAQNGKAALGDAYRWLAI